MLVDYLAARPDGGCTAVDGELGLTVLTGFVEWRFAFGSRFGIKGAAQQALSDLAWLRTHAGLGASEEDLSSSAMRAIAVPCAVRVPLEGAPLRQAGPVPLPVLVLWERSVASLAVALQQPGGEASTGLARFVYGASALICLYASLRVSEGASATLDFQDEEWQTHVAGTFRPKGSKPGQPRAQFRFWAWGILGPWLWWPFFRAVMRHHVSLFPACGVSDVRRARDLQPTHAPRGWPRDQIQPLLAVLSGASVAALASLDVRGHSLHQTMTDVMTRVAADCAAFTFSLDALAHGNWAGAQAQGLAIPVLYTLSKGASRSRIGGTAAKRAAVWRIVAVTAAAVREVSVDALVQSAGSQLGAGSRGWDLVAIWASAFVRSGGAFPLPEPAEPFPHPVWSPAQRQAALVRVWPHTLLALQ